MVMLQVWHAIACQFDSHLGNFLLFFKTLFITFQTFPLGVRFRLWLAFSLWLALSMGKWLVFGLGVSIRGSFHVRWSSKMGFFIWPSPKFTKFYKGKDLTLLSSTNLEFLKSDLYFRNYEHLKFWCFSRGLDQKILGVLLLELQLLVTPLSLNIFIQYFTVNWKPPCWTKQHRMFFTDDLWTLVNHCYEATCFSCAFKHDDILNTYNSNSATSIDFIFYGRAGVTEILLYLGHLCLFTNFRQKTFMFK